MKKTLMLICTAAVLAACGEARYPALSMDAKEGKLLVGYYDGSWSCMEAEGEPVVGSTGWSPVHAVSIGSRYSLALSHNRGFVLDSQCNQIGEFKLQSGYSRLISAESLGRERFVLGGTFGRSQPPQIAVVTIRDGDEKLDIQVSAGMSVSDTPGDMVNNLVVSNRQANLVATSINGTLCWIPVLGFRSYSDEGFTPQQMERSCKRVTDRSILSVGVLPIEGTSTSQMFFQCETGVGHKAVAYTLETPLSSSTALEVSNSSNLDTSCQVLTVPTGGLSESGITTEKSVIGYFDSAIACVEDQELKIVNRRRFFDDAQIVDWALTEIAQGGMHLYMARGDGEVWRATVPRSACTALADDAEWEKVQTSLTKVLPVG